MSWQNWHRRRCWNRGGLGDRWSLSIGGIRGWRWFTHRNVWRRRCRCKCEWRRTWRTWFLRDHRLRRTHCWRRRFEFLFLTRSSTFWWRRGVSQLFILCYNWRGRRCSNGNRLLDADQFIRSRRRRRTRAEAGHGNRTALRDCRFLLVLSVVLFDFIAL